MLTQLLNNLRGMNEMASTRRIDQHVIEKIKTILESLEYGTVQISVHDSQVTQIDKIEKHRFPLVKKTTKDI
jgi:hypothetical protein